jgi:transcriptional regulator with XRE-family HTH domain
MDDLQIGAALRRLRVRSGRRQVDVARMAGVSQWLVSTIECGRLHALSLETRRRVFAAVDARFDARVLWRGAALDCLVDEGHARLVEASVAMLQRDAWDVRVEVSYAVYGERGSIDVLGARSDCFAVVVEEVKTELVRLEETIRKLDEKERLVRRQLASDRFGWTPAVVGRVLVLPDTDRARRQVRVHRAVLDVAFPARPADVRRWLRCPQRPVVGDRVCRRHESGRSKRLARGRPAGSGGA